MKRSEINALMRDAVRFFEAHQFKLPPFAFWTPGDWKKNRRASDEILHASLGWDLTDFGSGDFDRKGLLLFTIRNGNYADNRYEKPYAEKIMIVGEGQETPTHFHWKKMEDIINRGGGNLVIRLHGSTPEEGLAREEVRVQTDGVTRRVPAGGEIRLTPGESITLPRGLYHSFWGEPGRGRVLVGEVSCVNDDCTDNRFFEPCGRFPDIVEDEPPLYLLCTDYPRAVPSA